MLRRGRKLPRAEAQNDTTRGRATPCGSSCYPGRHENPIPRARLSSMLVTLLMLPPQTATTREWASRIADAVPDLTVVVAKDLEEAGRVVGGVEAAFGTIPPALLRQATRLRWLQAPQAAPPAGYYYPELIAHPAVVTNFREIYNDHIGAHIMAFVLAFA